MPTPPDILAQQIHRLMIADDDKKRLTEDLKGLDEKSLEELTQLIKDHDKEAMEVLDEKAAEQVVVKDRMLDTLPEEERKEVGGQELEELQNYLIEIFSDSKKLADFLAQADDVLIIKLAEFMHEVFQDDPERQNAVGNFFKEVRLQKMALKKDGEEQEKELIKEAIEVKKQQIEELDQVISEVEEQLSKAEKGSE